MTAAIYARKSTEQTGVADEQKSVARQVEHARQYAERKGWTVDDASVFVDDGISRRGVREPARVPAADERAEAAAARSRCSSCPRNRGSDGKRSRPRTR